MAMSGSSAFSFSTILMGLASITFFLYFMVGGRYLLDLPQGGDSGLVCYAGSPSFYMTALKVSSFYRVAPRDFPFLSWWRKDSRMLCKASSCRKLLT